MFIPCRMQRGGTLDNTAESMSDDGQTVAPLGLCSSCGDRHGPEFICRKVRKGVWWMPWLIQAMKDVISCDKPRVGANDR